MPVNEGPLCTAALICLEEERVLDLDGETCLTHSETVKSQQSVLKEDVLCFDICFVFNSFRGAVRICLRNNLYVDLSVVSLCLVSADVRGLGPQQPETI